MLAIAEASGDSPRYALAEVGEWYLLPGCGDLEGISSAEVDKYPKDKPRTDKLHHNQKAHPQVQLQLYSQPGLYNSRA